MEKEHLFISYAIEDAVLAEWLTRKLTAYGYKVWCDRFNLLGGESFPRDIDKAIKDDTFRLLALLSKSSLEKPNSTKERTLALNIARERKIDFLIPLKVEHFSSTDINWMMSDITYIPFDEGWANGLARLLKKLDNIETPKTLLNSQSIAASTFCKKELIDDRRETLYSNIIKIIHIPDVISRFELRRCPNTYERDQIAINWPVYPISDSTFLSFQSPPELIASQLSIRKTGGRCWRDISTIDGVNTSNIITSLLRTSLEVKCLQKGLNKLAERNMRYFPSGLLEKNKISYIDYRGKKTHVLAVGQRSKGGLKYRYHLAPKFHIRRDLVDRFSILLRVHLFITDQDFHPLTPRSALSRRKHLCKNWWNSEWLKRQMAIVHHISDGQETFSVGSGYEAITFSSKFETYEALFGINESLLSSAHTREELDFIDQADEKEYKYEDQNE